MRGSKNYSQVTHKASKKGTKERQKAVWDMVGAKAKLHEMVEALIGGDSKAAAAALHDYLQAKTRAVLGENDMDDMGDEDGESCPVCHQDPCECDEDGDEGNDFDEDVEDEDGEEFGHEEHDWEEPELGEGTVGPAGTGGGRGSAMSTDASVRTGFGDGHSFSNSAPDLDRKRVGKINFKTRGKARLTHPFDNAAPGLDRKVKGDINFDSHGSAKLTHPATNAAPGLDRRTVGRVKYN